MRIIPTTILCVAFSYASATQMPDYSLQKIDYKGVRSMCSDNSSINRNFALVTETPISNFYNTKRVTKKDALSVFGEMRNFTKEEAAIYDQALNRMFKPTDDRLVL